MVRITSPTIYGRQTAKCMQTAVHAMIQNENEKDFFVLVPTM